MHKLNQINGFKCIIKQIKYRQREYVKIFKSLFYIHYLKEVSTPLTFL